ncbi:MAG: capsule assembly Wzi family protein [Treponema sp.]|nr:capsule assembly Wzi family protein [Treponema sp.]
MELRASPFILISPGDPLLEDLRFLVRESGTSFRSFTPPLSRDEVLQILDDVDAVQLSAPAREVYRRVYDAVKPVLVDTPQVYPTIAYTAGAFALQVQGVLAPEIHIRTNPSIPFTKRDAESPPFMAAPITLFFDDFLQLAVEPLVTSDPSFYEEAGSAWGTNVPYTMSRFDMNMPLRGFIAAGGAWWNFQLGRDKVSYGTAHTGNLAFSDTPDYYDFARLSVFSTHFKYSLLVSQLPLDTSELLAAGASVPEQSLEHTTQRHLYLHRIDARFFHTVSLGFSEGIMVGNAPLELRFLNPFVMFHSFYAWRDYDKWGASGDTIGSLFSCDIDWAALPSLAVYGQLVMNEFAMAMELEGNPNQPPNGLGYLAGIEYTHTFTEWRAAFYGEFVYTDPYLYTLSSPFGSFIWMRRLSDIGSKDIRYLWIGHPAGRDTLLFALGSVVSKGNLVLSADISFINRGEHTIRWDWEQTQEARNERTPSGIAERQLLIGVGTTWKPLPRLALSGYLGSVMVFDANHVKGTNAYGGEMSFSVRLTY